MLLMVLVNRIGLTNVVTVADPTQSVATSMPPIPSKPSTVEINKDLIFADDEDLLGDLA